MHALALAGCLALPVACARYQPLPLPLGPDLAPNAPTHPLTLEALVKLALEDAPELKAARAEQGVAQSQLLQARLVPDPVLGASILPLVAGPGDALGWSASVSEDIKSLVTLRQRKRAARRAADQVSAAVLWREWRLAGEVRALGLQLIFGERRLALQKRALGILEARDRALQIALQDADETLPAARTAFTATQTLRSEVAAEERQALSSRQQLNGLLGREPAAPLTLVDDGEPSPLNPDQIDRLAADLARRRPDLVALRLGYASQEARVRTAILNQFPVLTLGAAGGSDNSNVRNAGPQFTLTLPIFERGAGEIAVQRSTRNQLAAEYRARLDAAYAEIRVAAEDIRVDAAALARIRLDLPAARAAAQAAQRAYDARLIDSLEASDLLTAALAKDVERIHLEEGLASAEATLATLTGAGLPVSIGLPEAPR